MDEKEFEQFINSQRFRRAITAERNPHEYIVRFKTVCGSDEDFVRAVYFIRQNGFKINFWGREYTVYALHNRFYWAMGSSDEIEDITILNRNDLNDYVLTLRSKYEGKKR